MDGEQVEGLPGVLREWIEVRAGETGRSREEVLARAVTVAKLLDEHEEELPDPSTVGDAGEAASRLDVIETRIDELDRELDEKIDDVRSRVIQVKRETDAKAEADHDHPELAGAESVEDLADDVDSLRGDLSDLEETFESGFANYEEVLEYLTDAADEHDEKLSRLAAVLSDVRARVSTLESREAHRRAAADLKAEANRLGIATADCDGCGGSVRLGLLSSPECPHCGSTFETVEPAAGFFGSPSLVVGTRPALEGETVDERETRDIFEEE
ncbi:CopG family transcriptional regulator [Halobaculum magnesiiphilum]|uniref:CopG family transcriptional regulator n=1 Tax=Halobaculum magnesiiphilum TaxID=1017351 RepID=A0A8T8WG67_9EURY|nr:CopG family transcriptional regulator [Halobaculum magnesiiphilum]QZP38862.1 CopG family transcriptional regulator [Halobaculum magnesiiphilum]